jgi:putative addiction module component (TIGR02574 family)
MDQSDDYMNPESEFEALFKLPVAQRLQLVEDLWDSIARDSKTELSKGHAEFNAEPNSGTTGKQNSGCVHPECGR